MQVNWKVQDWQKNKMYDSVAWREQYIFGSSRLGLYRADTLVNKGLQTISKLYEGKRNYELTNHLGNILAVINDRKTDSLSATNVKLGYNAVVISATDYFPFGMAIDSRSYTSSLYRYGFNEQERDDEINGNTYTAEFWEYDARSGRRWNLDPKPDPSISQYVAFDNNPIVKTDPNGDCSDCPDKPVDSKYLGGLGFNLGSFGNGVADGFVGAVPELGQFVFGLATSSEARNNFLTSVNTLLNDPINTVKGIASEKIQQWGNVLSGNGTEEEKYSVGRDVGSTLFAFLTGAGISKLREVINVAKYEKELVKIAEEADRATGAYKTNAVRGTKVHSKFDELVKSEGKNGEVGYRNRKKVDGYREEGTSNPDDIFGSKKKPKIAYDLKTGKPGIPPRQLSKLKRNLPKGTLIKEISKGEDGLYKVIKRGKS